MNLKDTYNKIAEDWYRDHIQDSWWTEGTDMFANMLPKHSHVLDVGCGVGMKTKYLTQKGLIVRGVDFSEKMIEIAKREVPEASFEVCDIFELEKMSQIFDALFMQAVLLHVPKARVLEVILKCKTKIKDGGLLYIAVKEIRENQAEELVKKENDYGYPYERFFSFFTLPELERYIDDAGMELVWKSVKEAGRVNWLQVIARKK